MPWMDDITDRFGEIVAANEKSQKQVKSKIPETEDERAGFVETLWQDATGFEKNYYLNTRHMRRIKPSAKQPYSRDEWQKAAESLAYGEDWIVWGNRKDPNNMVERVDGEIPRKMAVRKDHITANYHEFNLEPNVKEIRAIFAEERKDMGWKDWIEEYVDHAMTYGRAVNEIVLDFSENPLGQVRNITRPHWRRTPEAKSFAKRDGCNYVMFAESVTEEQISDDFPELDQTKLSTSGSYTREDQRQYSQNYEHTQFFDKYRLYIDDPTIEEIPFGENEQLELANEHLDLMDGKPVDARPDQHHMHHIIGKLEALRNFAEVKPETEGEVQLQAPIISAYQQNIDAHMKFVESDPSAEARGLRRKYPNGRYICWIGGKIVVDVPNPLNVPWRILVREVANRKVAGRLDGAGDPEVMFNEAFQSDLMRSRIEDVTIAGIPKIFRHIGDKNNAQVMAGGDDNDPWTTSFYADKVPFVVKMESPQGFTELYRISKSNIQGDTNVNEISVGAQQPSGTPAYQVELLQRQNRTVITGQLDRNLREALEDIIEADLIVMKVNYTKERTYVLDGAFKTVNISEYFSQAEVDTPEGKKLIPITRFQVTIKPGSNYPEEWSYKLAMLIRMADRETDPAVKAAYEAAIMDHLAAEYPDFAEGGKYRALSVATTEGIKVLQEKQRQEEELQKNQQKKMNDIESVSRAMDRKLMKEQSGALQVTGGNGNG